MFSVDHTGYNCPITGSWIGSKREHQENLAKHGCRVLETGEREQNEAHRRKVEAEFERKIEDTVEKELSTWDSSKMEQLSNELVNGKVDVEVLRN